MQDIVTEAENISGKICELCGRDGYLCVNGWWYKTLCKTCCDKNGYKKENYKKLEKK